MIEHKNVVDVRWKGLDSDSGSIELYAAVFDVVDKANERIEPFAFKNLAEFVKTGFIAREHDWKALPVATVDSAVQDAKGLRIVAHFHSTPEAQAVRTTVRERLARGKNVGASIGYRVTDEAKVNMGGRSIRALKSIDLFEASIVQVPCNPEAGVIGAKSRPHGSGTAAFVTEYRKYLDILKRHDPQLRLHSAARGTGTVARLAREFLAIQARHGR